MLECFHIVSLKGNQRKRRKQLSQKKMVLVEKISQNTDARITLWNSFLYSLTFNVFLKWRIPICNSLFINVPSEKLKKNADMKMIINLICNYILFTMSKPNKSFTGQNVFYLNILHYFIHLGLSSQ